MPLATFSLVLDVPLPDWTDAACREETGVDWFEDRTTQANVKRAREVCACCPIQAECLQFAMDSHAQGIWSSTTWTERRDLRLAASKRDRMRRNAA